MDGIPYGIWRDFPHPDGPTLRGRGLIPFTDFEITLARQILSCSAYKHAKLLDPNLILRGSMSLWCGQRVVDMSAESSRESVFQNNEEADIDVAMSSFVELGLVDDASANDPEPEIVDVQDPCMSPASMPHHHPDASLALFSYRSTVQDLIEEFHRNAIGPLAGLDIQEEPAPDSERVIVLNEVPSSENLDCALGKWDMEQEERELQIRWRATKRVAENWLTRVGPARERQREKDEKFERESKKGAGGAMGKLIAKEEPTMPQAPDGIPWPQSHPRVQQQPRPRMSAQPQPAGPNPPPRPACTHLPPHAYQPPTAGPPPTAPCRTGPAFMPVTPSTFSSTSTPVMAPALTPTSTPTSTTAPAPAPTHIPASTCHPPHPPYDPHAPYFEEMSLGDLIHAPPDVAFSPLLPFTDAGLGCESVPASMQQRDVLHTFPPSQLGMPSGHLGSPSASVTSPAPHVQHVRSVQDVQPFSQTVSVAAGSTSLHSAQDSLVPPAAYPTFPLADPSLRPPGQRPVLNGAPICSQPSKPDAPKTLAPIESRRPCQPSPIQQGPPSVQPAVAQEISTPQPSMIHPLPREPASAAPEVRPSLSHSGPQPYLQPQGMFMPGPSSPIVCRCPIHSGLPYPRVNPPPHGPPYYPPPVLPQLTPRGLPGPAPHPHAAPYPHVAPRPHAPPTLPTPQDKIMRQIALLAQAPRITTGQVILRNPAACRAANLAPLFLALFPEYAVGKDAAAREAIVDSFAGLSMGARLVAACPSTGGAIAVPDVARGLFSPTLAAGAPASSATYPAPASMPQNTAPPSLPSSHRTQEALPTSQSGETYKPCSVDLRTSPVPATQDSPSGEPLSPPPHEEPSLIHAMPQDIAASLCTEPVESPRSIPRPRSECTPTGNRLIRVAKDSKGDIFRPSHWFEPDIKTAECLQTVVNLMERSGGWVGRLFGNVISNSED